MKLPRRIFVLLGLAAAMLAAALLLQLTGHRENALPTVLPDAQPTAAGAVLAAPEDLLPKNLMLGHPAPTLRLSAENGALLTLDELSGDAETVCLLFWASWCPDCAKQFAVLEELAESAASLGVSLVLVDRVQPGKESVEAAKEKLRDSGVTLPCAYDFNEETYSAFGMREIPGFVFLSRKGTVLDYASGVLTPGEFKGLCRRAVYGRAAENRRFIETNMMNPSGGVISSAVRTGTASGRDVLSESMGLYMLCTVLEGEDEKRFSAAYDFVEEQMIKNGLCAWYVSENGKRGEVNSFLDDLRIAGALSLAAEKWGGEWAARFEQMRTALMKHCISRQGIPVDFVQLNGHAQARTLSLCYLDLTLLRETEILSEAQLQKAEAVLLNGRISDAFPLYYSSYNLKSRDYSKDDLNTAEALYALWNLSRASLLPDDTLAWVKDHVRRGDLAARYTVEGETVPGSEYHSTGVYAMAALIGLSTGDAELTETAVRRMNRLYVLDVDDPRYGSYSAPGANYYAFDQLMPLLVNTMLCGGEQ